jgi:5-deoxy-glucuronate isomerase
LTDIAAAAPPNSLTPDQLRLAQGEVVTPERAGWRYLSFRVDELDAGRTIALDPAQEAAIVLIAGADLRVEAADSAVIVIPGRPSPFDALPHAVYVPAGHGVTLAAEGRAVVAVAQAPPSGRDGVASEPRLIGPSQVAVEVRGAGNATRQINHIITPEFPADRLEVVEVYTPSGNWSSWPPHKHDTDDMPREAVLEEIYFYQFCRPEAWGIQRLYRADGSRDALWSVRHGETVLVTDGYHPFVAAHGDDAYYLNVLAGDRRTMACSFDPALDHVRADWTAMEADPRVPLVRPLSPQTGPG